MQENTTQQEVITQEEQKALKSKTTIFGAILLILAVIGFISTIVFATKTTIGIVENKKGKQEFAEYIAPLVVTDPPTYTTVDKLDIKTVLTAAIWNLLKNEDLSKYEKDEFQFITVPKTDVEAYATKLFGDGLKFEHQPLGDAYYSFEYNTEDGEYTIPTSNVFVPYTPEVTKIQRNGDNYTLTVEYISTNDFLKSENEDTKKIREYVLKKIDKKQYNIISIIDPKVAETSSVEVVSSEVASSTTSETSSVATASATTSVASK